ncbi:hypothetical protein ABZZ36_30170 [Actinacidiphila glaucinigra]|uniref:hypothetical protein n=1 Tax=Actinacidiphila glaucinigra TaxID=235986 RepID=UPI0033BB23BC
MTATLTATATDGRSPPWPAAGGVLSEVDWWTARGCRHQPRGVCWLLAGVIRCGVVDAEAPARWTSVISVVLYSKPLPA